MAKFEIKIRIGSKEYFDMTARYMPFEIMAVEEFPDTVLPKAPPAVVEMAERIKARHSDSFGSSLRRKKRRRGSLQIDLTKGINSIIMGILADGNPHRANDMRDAFAAGGFSKNSVGSRLQNLAKHGVVWQVGDGTWRLANAPNTKETSGIASATS